jgi:HYR domain
MVATSSLTLESNSTAGGAMFNYTVSAVDTVDGAITAMTCNQASGSVLSIGNNTVTCSASDNSNNAASASLSFPVTAPTPAPTKAPVVTSPQSAKSAGVYVPNAWQGCLIAAASALLLCALPVALRRRRKENNEVPPSIQLAEVIPQGV